jgi:hypothetical protein
MKRNYTVIARALTLNGRSRPIGATVTLEERDGDTLVRAGRLEAVRNTDTAPLTVDSQPSSIKSEIVPAKPKRKAKASK